MKLTRRQLKAMILEVLTDSAPIMPPQQVEKLKVLDFDDTIADTSEQVKLYTDHGQSHRMVSSDEFAVYEPGEGEYYDDSSFYQFDDVDLNTAIPIQPVVEILKNFVNAPGSRKILILTARKQIAEPGIRRFLQSVGIDDTNIDVVGVASKDPAAKVQVIDHYLNNILQGVNFVSFFDDSGPNAATVKKYLDELGIRNDVAQVMPGDDASQKKLLRLKESTATGIDHDMGRTEQYIKHASLNAGMVARNIMGFFKKHPEEKDLPDSIRRRLAELANDLYYTVIPPWSHHTDDDLQSMAKNTVWKWFKCGYMESDEQYDAECN